MKFLTYFFLVTSFSALSAQSPKFDITYSEPLAVFVFVNNLSVNYPPNAFKEVFTKSKYATEKYNRLIEGYDTLVLDYSYSFDEYPYGSKQQGMTLYLLKKNLIASQTLEEFKRRSIGLIANDVLIKLCAVLETFAPVYRDIIYEPNRVQFEKQLSKITEYAEHKDIGHYFSIGYTFYHSNWDNSIPFEIAFYPLPDAHGFTAEAFYNNAVSAIQTDFEDYDVLLSVLLHEIFHILYNEQSLSFKRDIDSWFSENPSQNSRYAYLLLNEALATALGNGYVFQQLSGAVDTADWYNQKYINLMAKKIFPVVIDYIEKKKPIDKDFVNTYIELYDSYFADWTNELPHIMTNRYVLSDNEKDFSTVNATFPYMNTAQYETPITGNALDKCAETPITKIIVISQDNASKLALVKKKFAELKKWKYNPKRNFSYTVWLKDKTKLTIFNFVEKDYRLW